MKQSIASEETEDLPPMRVSGVRAAKKKRRKVWICSNENEHVTQDVAEIKSQTATKGNRDYDGWIKIEDLDNRLRAWDT
eukprot:4316086-Amphidinium_carterae.1